MRRAFLWSAAPLFCAIACQSSARQVAARRLEVESTLARYADLVGRVANDSIAALYTSDGELLGTNMRTIRGPDSIRVFLSSFANVRVDTARMRSDGISILGNEAVQWGTYAQTATVPGRGTVNVQGRFVAHWLRQPDGTWRLRRMLAQPAPVDR
jgi:ketosteroid isomerase-like protein